MPTDASSLDAQREKTPFRKRVNLQEEPWIPFRRNLGIPFRKRVNLQELTGMVEPTGDLDHRGPGGHLDPGGRDDDDLASVLVLVAPDAFVES